MSNVSFHDASSVGATRIKSQQASESQCVVNENTAGFIKGTSRSLTPCSELSAHLSPIAKGFEWQLDLADHREHRGEVFSQFYLVTIKYMGKDQSFCPFCGSRIVGQVAYDAN